MTKSSRPFCQACAALTLLILLAGSPLTLAQSLNAEEQALLTTRTPVPDPSPELIRSLDIGVPDWHKKGAPQISVKLDPAVITQSTVAALTALNALDPASLTNDFDRAWVVYQTASALKALGRTQEAAATFERVLNMRRTQVQDRYARVALHELGDEQQIGWCEDQFVLTHSAKPAYPPLALARGIEGWVKLILDVQADGRISHVVIHSSSLSVFEPPLVDWYLKQRLQSETGATPGQPCFANAPVNFYLGGPGMARVSISQTAADDDFSFRSIGVARRIRGAARDTAIKSQADSK